MPKSRKYTLVVIDMQPYFKTSLSVVPEVKREILKARSMGCPVLFVEYSLYDEVSHTHQELIAASSNVRSAIIQKNRDDGSEAIDRFLRTTKWPCMLHICGVNTDYCVKSTVEGLHTYFPRYDLIVVSNACAASYEPRHQVAIRQMTEFAHIL